MTQLDQDFFQAVKDNSVEVTKFYLRLGADVNVKDDDGWTALKYASKYSCTDIINLLKQYGAIDDTT